MSRLLATLTAGVVLAWSAPTMADTATSATDPGATATTTPDSASVPVATDQEAKSMPAIVVTVPKPQVWTFQKGNSKVLVLGTVYPEPQGLTFTPISIRRAIAQSGAVIGQPWFHFGAKVNLFNVWGLWHAASKAIYLTDGKTLTDVLPPETRQHWLQLKAQYLPHNHKVERMRPMYAGWKLYEAVIKYSGVASDSVIDEVIAREAKKHGVPFVDAQFHWTVKDPKTAARAFQPNAQADLACFEKIMAGIQSVPENARTMAKAWALGDVATMQSYIDTHPPGTACWIGMTDKAVAKQQGLDRDAVVRKAWLDALHGATAKYPVVFTTASVRDIFHPDSQVKWLLEDGYVMEPLDPAQAPAPATSAATTAPASASAAH